MSGGCEGVLAPADTLEFAVPIERRNAMDILDLAIRIVAGLVLGAAIGFERQLRSRTAGVRTNALVSLGSALFVIMGAFSFTGSDADPNARCRSNRFRHRLPRCGCDHEAGRIDIRA